MGDIRTALYAVLALKPQVSRQEMDISGDSAKVYAVTFETTGSQIGEAVQPHRDELPPQLSKWIDEIEKDPDFYVRTTFFLDQRELVKLETHIQYSGGSSVVKVALDKEQELEPLELGLETKKEDNLNRIRVCVKTVSGADSYQEEILMTKTQNGVQSSGTMNYDYDLSTGEMDLCVVTGSG